MRPFSIWIGYDSTQTEAFAVARNSAYRRLTIKATPITGIRLKTMQALGLYWRPTERRDGKLWDTISQAPMSTEFAISRFLTPLLAKQGGYALFMDSDMLVRGNLLRLREEIGAREADIGRKAVWIVPHEHIATNETKMGGQIQTNYGRKNWSSFMVFDTEHHGNKRLTLDLINSARGINLHQFCWLEDGEIGFLHPRWNWLVGHTKLEDGEEPKVVHYTDGGPWHGIENLPYADEWDRELSGFVGCP